MFVLSVVCVCSVVLCLFVCSMLGGRFVRCYVCVCVVVRLFVFCLDGAAWQGEFASVCGGWREGDHSVAGVAEGGIYLPFKNSIY